MPAARFTAAAPPWACSTWSPGTCAPRAMGSFLWGCSTKRRPGARSSLPEHLWRSADPNPPPFVSAKPPLGVLLLSQPEERAATSGDDGLVRRLSAFPIRQSATPLYDLFHLFRCSELEDSGGGASGLLQGR